MSTNTSIKEGGQARSFGPVAALMVQGSDGQYYPWVPLSERQLDTLSVTKNGIYQAKKLGVYGWRSVSVNVPTDGSVTGKDPETGQQVAVTTDPTTGEIVETVVPVEIRVTTPPTKTEYIHGEAVNTEGMVVKAYGANGNEMMTVPLSEIMLNPATAVYDSESQIIYETTSEIDTSPIRQPFPCSETVLFKNLQFEVTYTGGIGTGFFVNESNHAVVLASSSKFIGMRTMTVYDPKTGIPIVTRTAELSGGNSKTINGKTVYYASAGGNLGTGDITPTAGSEYVSPDRGNLAWAMVYGDLKYLSGGMTITVSWHRPGDGAILETTFDIIVGPHGGTGDD